MSRTGKPRDTVRQIPSATEKCSPAKLCARCQSDRAFLFRRRRPTEAKNGTEIKLVDLFAGCGGMTLGLHEAARHARCRLTVSLAVDSDPQALSIYEANFPTATTQSEDVAEIFDGCIACPTTLTETKIADELGDIDILVGGPPCQGHSDLNNYTRRADPKNILYLRMARAAEVLRPKVIVIENVATVHLDKGGVVEATLQALKMCGYVIDTSVVDLCRVGVPQSRRRFILLATNLKGLEPSKILADLENSMPDHSDRTVRWAIDDLRSLARETVFDTPSKATIDNARRIDLLFERGLYDLPNESRPECHRDKEHSYVSMYGRLRPERPAQTITTGFGSMGQGRYIHPECKRTITPHEAARLQTFPDWFKFGRGTRRGVLAGVIGNAVPPLLMREIGASIIPAIVAANEAPSKKLRRRA
jgi:DNA (cytosine-5)-methyltransferase 1